MEKSKTERGRVTSKPKAYGVVCNKGRKEETLRSYLKSWDVEDAFFDDDYDDYYDGVEEDLL